MDSLKPGRLPSTSAALSRSSLCRPRLSPRALSPSSACALPDGRARDFSDLSPGPRCFHRGTGFRRPFTTRAQGRMARPRWIFSELAARCDSTPRPNAARRLLQPEQPASTTVGPPDPQRGRPMQRVQLALDWEVTPEGVEAPSATSTADSGRHRNFFAVMNLAARSRHFRLVPAEVFRARGRPALAARRLTPSARKQVAELRPDPISSDTSCHEIAPMPGGEPNTAGRSAEAERHSSDPVSQAGPRAQTRDCWLVWPPHGPLSRDQRPERTPHTCLRR